MNLVGETLLSSTLRNLSSSSSSSIADLKLIIMISTRRILTIGLLLIVQYTNAEQQQEQSSNIIQLAPPQQHNSLRGSGSRSQSQNTSISKIQLESLIDKPDFEGEERLMKALTSKSKVYVSLLG